MAELVGGGSLIPLVSIEEWRESQAPWQSAPLIEHDLLISRAVVEIFSDPTLQNNVAWRGGTALNKLFFEKPLRFSEDIDLVKVGKAPTEKILELLRARLEPWLGKPEQSEIKGCARLAFSFLATSEPPVERNLKIDLNFRETFSLLGLAHRPFDVQSPWFSGNASVTTFLLEEMMATKLRALHQRRIERDLFDLAMVLEQHPAMDREKVVGCFLEYMKRGGEEVPRKAVEGALARKLLERAFQGDVEGLLPGNAPRFDPYQASRLVFRELVDRMADPPGTAPSSPSITGAAPGSPSIIGAAPSLPAAQEDREALFSVRCGAGAWALDQYERAGAVHEHARQEEAMRSMVEVHTRALLARPGEAHLMLAYERPDVIKLNELAREQLRTEGALGEEQAFAGRKFFIGDRVFFKNREPDLEIPYRAMGTVEAVTQDGLSVRLDGQAGRIVTVGPEKATELDPAHAMVLKKTESVVADRVSVLASPMFDRLTLELALSRHREQLEIHWSRERFADRTTLYEKLTGQKPVLREAGIGPRERRDGAKGTGTSRGRVPRPAKPKGKGRNRSRG